MLDETMTQQGQKCRGGAEGVHQQQKMCQKCLKFVVIGITFDYVFVCLCVEGAAEWGAGERRRRWDKMPLYGCYTQDVVINKFPDSTLFREICFIDSILNMGYAININSVFHFVVEKFIFELNSITIIHTHTYRQCGANIIEHFVRMWRTLLADVWVDQSQRK